jgi:CBS-domain-containing membrane protein
LERAVDAAETKPGGFNNDSQSGYRQIWLDKSPGRDDEGSADGDAVGTTIGQADELMTTNRIRQVPVVQGHELIGIVTDRDIRSFLSGSLLESGEAREKALNTEVREIMTTEPMTVSPDDDLQEAVELMIDEKIGGIPVVDEAEGLVGIVTYVDVLRCFLNRLQEEQ